ncbi:hypothetical protein AB0N20_22500 [Streptomyces griseoincarnatus]
MTTTLHLAAEDVAGMSAGANGAVRIELTDAGARRLVTAADRHRAVLQVDQERRAAWLRSLTDAELVELATSRFGGPEPDVMAEGVRRVREALEVMRPALDVLRGAGVLEAGRG